MHVRGSIEYQGYQDFQRKRRANCNEGEATPLRNGKAIFPSNLFVAISRCEWICRDVETTFDAGIIFLTSVCEIFLASVCEVNGGDDL